MSVCEDMVSSLTFVGEGLKPLMKGILPVGAGIPTLQRYPAIPSP